MCCASAKARKKIGILSVNCLNPSSWAEVRFVSVASDFRLRFQVKSLPSSEMLIGFFLLAVFSTVVFKSNAFSSMSFN